MKSTYYLQVREYGEHDHPVLDQGVQLRQAGRREGRDRVRQVITSFYINYVGIIQLNERGRRDKSMP